MYTIETRVIPASEARRESSFKKDSGQAGMTEKSPDISIHPILLNPSAIRRVTARYEGIIAAVVPTITDAPISR